MTPALFVEVLLAVAVQTSVVFMLSAWLERLLPPAQRDRFWFVAQLLVLGMAVQALLLPHPRWAGLPSLVPGHDLASMQRAWNYFAAATLWIYLAGAGVRAALTVVGAIHAARGDRFTAASQPLTNALRQQFPDTVFARRQGAVRLANRRALTRCWRWQRPVIVLSRRVLELSEADRDMVMRHELAHLEAGHPLQVFVQRCVEALLWFHPLVWWSSRRADLAREGHCDAVAMGREENARNYFSILLTLAGPSQVREIAPVAALRFAREASMLERRVQAAATSRPYTRWAALATPLLMLAAVILAFTAWPPLSPVASARERWSPWPSWSTAALHSLGVTARDYEVDAHRLTRHHP